MASNDFTDSETESGTEDPQYTPTSVTTIHHPVAKPDRSSVLKYFDRSNLRRVCKLCKKTVGVGRQANKPSTGNLISHMRRNHPVEWDISEGKRILKEREKNDKLTRTSYVFVANSKTKKENQAKLSNWVKQPQGKYVANHLTQVNFNNSLGEWMIADSQSFNSLNHDYFKKAIHRANPRLTVLSKETFRTRIKDEVVKSVDEFVLKKIKTDCTSLMVTSDIWSTKYNHDPFISLTGHFLDMGWDYHSCILACEPFPTNHTQNNITEMIKKMLVNFEIPTSKVSVILSDSAPAMKNGCINTGIHHVPCVLHQINKAVENALKKQVATETLITRVSGIVTTCRKSHIAKYLFEDIQKDNPRTEKILRLIQQNNTRWFSKYYMMKRFVDKKEDIIKLMSSTDLIKEWVRPDEWRKIENLVKSLSYLADTVLL